LHATTGDCSNETQAHLLMMIREGVLSVPGLPLTAEDRTTLIGHCWLEMWSGARVFV